MTRPTSDRVKESLFNIIASYIEDADVLDLFSGTGNLGIEALSRGAKSAILADRNGECVTIIKDNLNHTKLTEKSEVFLTDAFNLLNKLSTQGRKFDIIFLDPPYNKNLVQEALDIISKNDIIKDRGIVVAERDVIDKMPETVGKLKLIRDQKYGDTVLSFYQNHYEA